MVSLQSVLEDPRETRSVELKRSMDWGDETTRGKVVRAALAMANLRDGGAVVFGFERFRSLRSLRRTRPSDKFSLEQRVVERTRLELNEGGRGRVANLKRRHQLECPKVLAVTVSEDRKE